MTLRFVPNTGTLLMSPHGRTLGLVVGYFTAPEADTTSESTDIRFYAVAPPVSCASNATCPVADHVLIPCHLVRDTMGWPDRYVLHATRSFVQGAPSLDADWGSAPTAQIVEVDDDFVVRVCQYFGQPLAAPLPSHALATEVAEQGAGRDSWDLLIATCRDTLQDPVTCHL